MGKSKNGIKDRPTSHEDKYQHWDLCYILTQFKERTFLNDGTIQYIEDELNTRVNKLDVYDNKTVTTTSGTANVTDQDDCNEFIDEALQMLDVLGLDLISYNDNEEDLDLVSSDSSFGTVPDGIYTMAHKVKRENKTFKAKMQVAGGRYIVLKGSMVCPSEAKGLFDSVVNKRNEAEIDGLILKEDVVLDSPSTAGAFVIGASCNGWTTWKCEDGSYIDKFRK